MSSDDSDALTDEEIEELLARQPNGQVYESVYDMVLDLSDYEFLKEFVDKCEERETDNDDDK